MNSEISSHPITFEQPKNHKSFDYFPSLFPSHFPSLLFLPLSLSLRLFLSRNTHSLLSSCDSPAMSFLFGGKKGKHPAEIVRATRDLLQTLEKAQGAKAAEKVSSSPLFSSSATTCSSHSCLSAQITSLSKKSPKTSVS